MAGAKNLKCGLIMPISAMDGYPEAHWLDVKRIIEQALEPTTFAVELVSSAEDVGVIHKRIVQNIYSNDIVVCDVSGKNPNVMFELGMRLAFDKPAIIVKDDITNYSFDTSPIEHLSYPRSLHYHTIEAFKLSLRAKVERTHASATDSSSGYTTFLKHFGPFVVAKLDERAVGKEDFVAQQIADMRQDISGLTKSVSALTDVTRTNADAANAGRVLTYYLNPEGEVSDSKYISNLIHHRLVKPKKGDPTK